MKLELRNIGLIEKGEIELKGITTIASENNTGKSTIGKSLFTLLYSTNNFKTHFLKELEKRFSKNFALYSLAFGKDEKIDAIKKVFFEKLKKQLLNEKIIFEEFESILSEMEKALGKLSKKADKNIILDSIFNKPIFLTTQELKNILNYEKIQKTIFETFFEKEFETSVVNLFSKNENSFIKFSDGYKVLVNVEFNQKNKINNIELKREIINKYDSIYIESPILLDNIKKEIVYNSLSFKDIFLGSEEKNIKDLKFSVFNEYITTQKETDSIDNILIKDEEENKNYILDKIKEEILGSVLYDNKNKKVIYKYKDKDFDVKNIATGIKSLGILEIFLSNNRLNKNTILIIDEPEVHLHPKWQLKYAEVLILISKKLNVKILLNSHSTYFIRALDIYGKYYNYRDNINFYTTYKDDNGSSTIKKAKENLEDIFETLLEPYDIFEELEGNNDE